MPAAPGPPPPAALSLPAFGFGCASLMAQAGRRESLAMLHAALDAGYTHFDVARMYGYGEAEAVVGEALRAHRDRVTITTKAGILPPRRSRPLALAKRGARAIATAFPPARELLRRRAGAMVSGGRFGVDDLRASLDVSQRELGVDRIDVLLLHEPAPADLSDDVHALAQSWLASGRIGAFGVAPVREEWPLTAPQPAGVQVLQTGDSACDEALPDAGVARVSHSAIARAVPRIGAFLRGPGPTREWSERVGADLSAPDVLASLALLAAAARNPDGTVLVASRDPGRIRSNARVLSGERRVDADLPAFMELARAAAPGRAG